MLPNGGKSNLLKNYDVLKSILNCSAFEHILQSKCYYYEFKLFNPLIRDAVAKNTEQLCATK